MARVPPMKDSTTIATAATNVQLRMRIALPRSPQAPGRLLYASRQLRGNSCLRIPQKPHEIPRVSALCHDALSAGLWSAGPGRQGGWALRWRPPGAAHPGPKDQGRSPLYGPRLHWAMLVPRRRSGLRRRCRANVGSSRTTPQDGPAGPGEPATDGDGEVVPDLAARRSTR